MANHVVSDTKDFFREYHLWVLLVIACTIAVWIASHRQGETLPSSKIDPFSGPLVIDAPGCEITGPDGKSLKAYLLSEAKAYIPKGTSFNGDCFPAAKAARAAEAK